MARSSRRARPQGPTPQPKADVDERRSTQARASAPDRVFPTLRRVAAFLHQLATAARQRGLLAQAGSLSWVTTLSLVPLLAAFSFVGAQLFESYRERIVAAVHAFVPWPEATLVDRLEALVVQAESVREIGALSFVVVSLGLFDAVEKSVNRLWGISKQRPLRRRLTSLAQLLFWGPIAIGLAVKLTAEVERALGAWVPSGLILGAMVFGALVMLFHGVPATRVRWRAACAGAAIATVLLEVLRRGFAGYTGWWLETGFTIYGSFALLVLFLLSIHLAWLALLLGALAAAVVQRGAVATGTVRPDAWVGLSTMLVLSQRLLQQRGPITAEALPLEIGCEAEVLDASVHVLSRAGLLHVDDHSGLVVLGASPFLTGAEQILDLFPATDLAIPDAKVRAGLETAITRTVAERADRLSGATLASLLGAAETNGQLAPSPASG